MPTNQNNSNTYRHTHNGSDSEQIRLEDILYTKGGALTAPDNGALSTGGTEDLITSDSDIINNMRTRLNELETRLKQLNLIQ